MAQSTDEIIRQHIDAVGGEENWDKIETIVIKSLSKNKGLLLHQTKSAIKTQSIRNDIHIEYEEAGRNDKMYYIIIHDNQGWKYLPEDRNNEIYTLYQSEIEQLKDEMDYEDPFIHYQQKGREINMIGIEYYNGKEYYKFLIQYKSGKKSYCYINTSTLMIDLIDTPGEKKEILQRFLDYKMLPEGIEIANRIIGDSGELNISSVIINRPLTKSIFEPSERNRYTIQH